MSRFSQLLQPGAILRDHSTITASTVVAVCVGIVWLVLGVSRADSQSDRAAEQTPVRVSVMTVAAEPFAYQPRYLGKVEAFQIVEIRSRVRGFLNDRLFREGGSVEEDEVLFRIDAKPFEAAVEVARARVESAIARQVQAERQVERYSGLYEQGAATASELEEWETSLQVAAADIELYKAQLLQAELDLSYTRIASPINGMVGRALKDVGTFVDDGSNSLLAVVEQVDPIYVQFSISQAELLREQRMREGGKLNMPAAEERYVALTLGDGVEHEHQGRITFMDVGVDTATATTMFRATVPNPEFTLRPGQFVNVRLLGYERPNVVIVPKQAVVQTPASASVYVVSDDEETVEVRRVRLGDWHGNGWIVEEGLHGGEVIVVDNIMRLRHRSNVQIEAHVQPEELDDVEMPLGSPPSLMPAGQ